MIIAVEVHSFWIYWGLCRLCLPRHKCSG